MILSERPTRKRRGDGRRSAGKVLLLAVLLVLAFLVGIAFARVLDERPKAGGVVTSVRTLMPLPQRPVTKTVTVTVTAP